MMLEEGRRLGVDQSASSSMSRRDVADVSTSVAQRTYHESEGRLGAVVVVSCRRGISISTLQEAGGASQLFQGAVRQSQQSLFSTWSPPLCHLSSLTVVFWIIQPVAGRWLHSRAVRSGQTSFRQHRARSSTGSPTSRNRTRTVFVRLHPGSSRVEVEVRACCGKSV